METIDEIVRKIRKSQNGNVHTISAKEAYELADCIEKSIEVERIEWRKMLKEAKDAIGVLEERRDAVEQCQTEDATCKESLHVGNAAKMCEALSEILHLIDKWRTDGVMEHWQYSQLFDVADKALSAPPRNCDVYTMAEQSKRHEEYCKSHTTNGRCGKCPLWQIRLLGINCAIAWANFPYEKEGEK